MSAFLKEIPNSLQAGSILVLNNGRGDERRKRIIRAWKNVAISIFPFTKTLKVVHWPGYSKVAFFGFSGI